MLPFSLLLSLGARVTPPLAAGMLGKLWAPTSHSNSLSLHLVACNCCSLRKWKRNQKIEERWQRKKGRRVKTRGRPQGRVCAPESVCAHQYGITVVCVNEKYLKHWSLNICNCWWFLRELFQEKGIYNVVRNQWLLEAGYWKWLWEAGSWEKEEWGGFENKP